MGLHPKDDATMVETSGTAPLSNTSILRFSTTLGNSIYILFNSSSKSFMIGPSVTWPRCVVPCNTLGILKLTTTNQTKKG